jgi:hypothetical protein
VTERLERTAQGYRRFRCRECGKQYNERSGSLLNHTQYPSDVIALVVLWRLRYRLTLRDLAEMFLVRGIVFSHEAVREWEAKLAPLLADELRRRRHGRGGARGRHWHVDETYLKVRGRWCYLYRAIDRDGRLGRVGDWRGGARLGGVAVVRRLSPCAGASFPAVRSVSSHRSSNRTCRFPASGFLPIRQTFALGRSTRRCGTR